jgi:hypothetical protein
MPSHPIRPSGEPQIGPDVERFSVFPEQALGVTLVPDVAQELRGQPNLWLYATHLRLRGWAPHWLLVGYLPDDNLIPFAFRIGHDLAPDLDQRDPLGLLTALAGRFGLTVWAGEQTGLLLAEARAPQGQVSADPGERATGSEADRDWRRGDQVRHFAYLRSDGKTGVTHVTLLFRLNATRYQEYLRALAC